MGEGKGERERGKEWKRGRVKEREGRDGREREGGYRWKEKRKRWKREWVKERERRGG